MASYKPASYKGSTLYVFPRPVVQLGIDMGWDVRKGEVPLKDGMSLKGLAKRGRTITVAGVVNILGSDGTGLCTELDRLDEFELLLAAVDCSGDTEKMEFFTHYDPGEATVGDRYRKYKSCVCEKISLGIGDDDLPEFPYNLTILTEDPVRYTTAPGA